MEYKTKLTQKKNRKKQGFFKKLTKKIVRIFTPKYLNKNTNIYGTLIGEKKEKEFKLEKEIGSGDYGKSLLLQNIENPEEKVVRKIPKKNGIDDFLNELKYLEINKNKNPSNLVKVLYISIPERILLLENCPYSSLDQVIRKNKLSELGIEKKTIILEILEGINFIHQSKYIHLDIALRNILLCHHSKGNKVITKICDFGKISTIPNFQNNFNTLIFDSRLLEPYIFFTLMNNLDTKIHKLNYYINDIWGLFLISLDLGFYPIKLEMYFSLSMVHNILFNIPRTSTDYIKELFKNSNLQKKSKSNIDYKSYLPTVLCDFCLENRSKPNYKNYQDLKKKLKNKSKVL